jgi:repressor LexA
MKRLEEKGYLKRAGRRNKQGVLLRERPASVQIPLLGAVAAGVPFEAVEQSDETVTVPEHLVTAGDHFALRVKGNSMVEDGMLDGDTIVIHRQNRADDGQTVVALLDSEATVKRFYRHDQQKIELRPANAAMKSIWVSGPQLKKFQVQGVVVGLFRQYA